MRERERERVDLLGLGRHDQRVVDAVAEMMRICNALNRRLEQSVAATMLTFVRDCVSVREMERDERRSTK